MAKATISIFVCSALLLPMLALAQSSFNGNTPPSSQNGNSYNVNGGGSVTVTNPLGPGTGSICGLIKKILQAALAIGIPIAVLFIVYAGFKFVMAQGSPEKLAEARQNFMWTLIGIGIFLGAWLLAQLIANTINQLQSGSGNSAIISCQ